MPEKIQDGHKKLGRWILAPVADITTTEFVNLFSFLFFRKNMS
jgi:hypothetical protein